MVVPEGYRRGGCRSGSEVHGLPSVFQGSNAPSGWNLLSIPGCTSLSASGVRRYVPRLGQAHTANGGGCTPSGAHPRTGVPAAYGDHRAPVSRDADPGTGSREPTTTWVAGIRAPLGAEAAGGRRLHRTGAGAAVHRERGSEDRHSHFRDPRRHQPIYPGRYGGRTQGNRRVRQPRACYG